MESRPDVNYGMPPDATESELIVFARSQGVIVSSDQLKRWRKAKLLPPVRRRGLGRGAGTETLYPPEALPWVVELARTLQADRHLGRAAWRLWLKGYPLTELARKYAMECATMLEGGLYRYARGEFTRPWEKGRAHTVPEVRAPLLALTRQPSEPSSTEAFDRLLSESIQEARLGGASEASFTFDGLPFDIRSWREALKTAPPDVLLATRDQVLLLRTVFGFLLGRDDAPPTVLLFLVWFVLTYVSGFGTALLDGIARAIKDRAVPQLLEEAQPFILAFSAAWRRLQPTLSRI